MVASNDSTILTSAICVIAIIGSLSWFFMAQPLAIYRKASLRFSVANFCVFAGFATSLYRDQSDPVVFWLASDVLILFAVFFYKKATYRLFKLNNNGLFDHALLLATAFCVAVTLIFDMDYLKVAIVLTALASATFTMIAFVKYHALTNDVPRPLAYAMVSPSFIVAVVLFVKAITLWVIPDVARSIFFRAQFDSIEVLWIYLVMFLLINVSAIASALMKLIFKIRDLAVRDQLTNLFNRRAIVRELAAAQRIYRREHIPFCVLLIDIDKFKNINDQYGHDVGDAAIKFVAERLQQQLRETDKLARYGGEEFLALLLNCELTTAHTVAEKLRSALELAPFEYQGNAIPITISVGVCAIDKANDVKTLIAMADKALYQAKHEGRNRTVDAAPIQS